MNTRIAAVIGCCAALATVNGRTHAVARGAGGKPGQFATISTLPSFGYGGEALAVNEAGTIIAGHAWDKSSLLHAVKWTLQSDGSWALSDLVWPTGVTSTIARGVNSQGGVAGNDFPLTASRALFWLTSTTLPLVLDCVTDQPPSAVYGISADAQVVVGDHGPGTTTPAVWHVYGNCRQDLPSLGARRPASARAVNGDGAIIGGAALPPLPAQSVVPVRWRNVAERWRIEQLDTREGNVFGANNSGDLAGTVRVPCGTAAACQRAYIWYATGASHELGTLGGADSWARDVNGTGEVVGVSTSTLRRAVNTAFFWSPNLAVGMLQLPVSGQSASANALSDVRPDGTRLAVGESSGSAVVWVIRTP